MNNNTNTKTTGVTDTWTLNAKNIVFSDKCQKQVKQTDGTYKYYDVLTTQQVENHLYKHKVIFSNTNWEKDRGFITIYNNSPDLINNIWKLKSSCGDGESSLNGYRTDKAINMYISIQFSNDAIGVWTIRHHSLGGDPEWHSDIYKYSDSYVFADYVTKIF